MENTILEIQTVTDNLLKPKTAFNKIRQNKSTVISPLSKIGKNKVSSISKCEKCTFHVQSFLARAIVGNSLYVCARPELTQP